MGKRGKLIVFEGIDGVGKSTQAKKLVRFLKKQGLNVVYTKEPTNGMLGKQIIHKLKTESRPNKEWLHVMFASDREHHTEEIDSYLSNGLHVVCDRYKLSGTVHATLDLGTTKAQKINKKLLTPDITFLILSDVLVASKIINNKKRSVEVYKSPNKLRQLQVLFKDMSKKDKTVIQINEKNKTKIHKKILDEVKKLLELKK